MQRLARTCFALVSVTTLCAWPWVASAQQRPAFETRTGISPQRQMAPSAGARIEPRIRSGMVERRGEPFRGPYANTQTNAPPLTVTRNARRGDMGERWVYSGRSFERRGSNYDDRGGWFPSLIAAPFLLPWYLLGGGSGAGYDPYYYEDPWYADPATYPAYPGPTTTFSAPLGGYCTTPQKTCLLYEPAEVGLGCSCRAPAGYGRFRGAVVP